MATSDHVDIAEAVKDSLIAATTLPVAVDVERRYVDTTDRTLTDTPAVFVMPQTERADIVSRQTASLHDYGVQVVVRAGVDVEADDFDDARIDDLLLLCEAIKDHLRDAGQMASATLVEMEHSPLWDSVTLHELHQFLSGMTFNYRLLRSP